MVRMIVLHNVIKSVFYDDDGAGIGWFRGFEWLHPKFFCFTNGYSSQFDSSVARFEYHIVNT